MKVTFPHMGNTYITLKAMLEELNLDVVVPPKCNKRTAEEGIKVSPEGICLPFKIMMGNYIESIDNGADTILMLSSCGDICRIGTFCQLQQDILNDMGCNVKMIPVKPFGNKKEIMEFLHILGNISNCHNDLYLYKTLITGLRLLLLVDEVYGISYKTRPIELEKGSTNNIIRSMETDINKSKGYKATFRIIREAKKKLNNLEVKPEGPKLRIGLIGEIYVLTEDYTNMYIDKQLGEMGVEVDKMMTTSGFIKKHLEFIPFLKSELKSLDKDAAPYLEKAIGGHTFETVGTAVRYKNNGYDGLVHILPFGCMPEIVSEGILKEVEKREDIPVLTMIYDELTGEAGYRTRLEAYVECLIRKNQLLDTTKKDLIVNQ